MATLENITELVRSKFPANMYALLEEVSDKAGYERSRSADYVAVNFWPSRGLTITGIELKSFRNDWLNEFKNPKKAEAIFKHCDYFYLLTTDDKIANLSEIPETWGWLCVKGKRIVEMKPAPKLDHPRDVSRTFVCALLKRATQGMIHHSQIKTEIEQRVTIGVESYKNGRVELERLRKEAKEAKDIIKEFENGSGIQLKSWRAWDKPEEIGKVVKFVIDGGADKFSYNLLDLHNRADKILADIKTHVEGITVIKKQEND